MSLIILNFHGIGPITRDIDDEERDCWLEKEYFEAMLDLVRDQPHVKLTFDDGNDSDAEIVLPSLLERKLSATFFVCSGRLGQPTFVNRTQVRELLAHGMSIGSHGAAHISWTKLSTARLKNEIEGSRHVLENVCGAPIDSAACPFGTYDRTVLSALCRAGYRAVYTSDGGLALEDNWLRARTSVKRTMSLADVQRLVLEGPGAWKQSLIDLSKLFKRLH